MCASSFSSLNRTACWRTVCGVPVSSALYAVMLLVPSIDGCRGGKAGDGFRPSPSGRRVRLCERGIAMLSRSVWRGADTDFTKNTDFKKVNLYYKCATSLPPAKNSLTAGAQRPQRRPIGTRTFGMSGQAGYAPAALLGRREHILPDPRRSAPILSASSAPLRCAYIWLPRCEDRASFRGRLLPRRRRARP